MFAMVAITTVCTAGIAFYVWFFVAICRECNRSWIGLLLRLRPEARECAVAVWEQVDESIEEAA